MRRTDDLADDPGPVDDRRVSLDRWRQSLDAALDGELDPTGPQPVSDNQSGSSPHDPGHMLLPALAETVRQFRIPPEHLHAVIDGVEMDLRHAQYETFDDLVEYCHRVASAVGLACIHIWGFRDDGAMEPARKTGIAFQITNILRDVREDAQRGRIYLPQEDLRRFDYSPGELARQVVDKRFFRLMEFEIERAERLYHAGSELLDWLEPDGRRIFGMMTAVYHGLLEKIARRPANVFSRRIRLGRLRLAMIAARWMLLPARRSSLP
jgi:phytoene synthase